MNRWKALGILGIVFLGLLAAGFVSGSITTNGLTLTGNLNLQSNSLQNAKLGTALNTNGQNIQGDTGNPDLKLQYIGGASSYFRFMDNAEATEVLRIYNGTGGLDARKTITVNQEDGNYTGIRINTVATASKYGIDIRQNGVLTSGAGMLVYSNQPNTNTAEGLVLIQQDHASATAPALRVDNDGSGETLQLFTGGGATKVFSVNATGNITSNALTGSGNAYVCVNANGNLYRSGAACV